MGCSATSRRSSPTTSACRPAPRSAAMRTSSAARRCSSSRAISASANGSNARSASGGPRQSASASRSIAAACAARPPGARRAAPVLDEPLEALGVELARLDADPVARGRRRRSPRRPRGPSAGARRGPGPCSPRRSAPPRPTARARAGRGSPGSFAWRRRTASSARGFRPAHRIGPSSPCTSSGPRIPNSMCTADATPLCGIAASAPAQRVSAPQGRCKRVSGW